jgi:hypothetical protein
VWSRQDPTVHLEHCGSHALDREMCVETSSPSERARLGHFPISKHSEHAGGQLVGAQRRHQDGTVADDLSDLGKIRRHNGRPKRERLDEHPREPLAARRQYEHVGGTEKLGDIIPFAQECHVVC